MSRSKRDILDTEHMLQSLISIGITRPDAQSLRRISITLHRWHELECGDSNDYRSSCAVRGWKTNGSFEYADDGRAYLEVHPHAGKTRYELIPDRETGAKRRLAKIMARYPSLSYYIQGDPRGCALYILRPGDVPAPVYKNADSCYSRGIAVYR